MNLQLQKPEPVSSANVSELPQIALRQELLPQKVYNLLPFKGKGSVAVRLMAVRRRREDLRQEADALAQQVRAIPGKRLSLVLSGERAKSGAWYLNWRGVARNSPRCRWPDQRIQSLLDGLGDDWRAWYADVAMTAMVLNCEETMLRAEQCALEQLLVDIEMAARTNGEARA